MWCTLQGYGLEVLKRPRRTAFVNAARGRLAAKHGTEFEVDQFGCGEAFSPQAGSRRVAVGTVVGECDDEDAGINDEHGRSESRALPS